MCLIVFAYKKHPRFDLIFAANRDESYQRPTRTAQFWDDHPAILAGKDLKAGGTWMGINCRGHFAALTNYRDPSIQKKDPPSRGEIVLNYLKGEKDSASFLKELSTRAHRYNGFNVLTGSSNELVHYSNREHKINRVAPGIHGLSNRLLDTPWPKVERSKSALHGLIENNNVEEEALFDLLQDEQAAPSKNLPDTGIAREIEKQLSPIFIKTDDYGTRSSTILLVDTQGNATFEERRYKRGTTEVDETSRFEFRFDS